MEKGQIVRIFRDYRDCTSYEGDGKVTCVYSGHNAREPELHLVRATLLSSPQRVVVRIVRTSDLVE